MKTRHFCLYCGGDANYGAHELCKQKLAIFQADILRHGPVRAMQLAESGAYKSVSKPSVSTTESWLSRAQELRNQGMKWQQIADQLTSEGFKTKQNKSFHAALILNHVYQAKRKKE